MGVFRVLPPVSASPLSLRQLWRGAVGPWTLSGPLAQRCEEFKAYLGVSHAYLLSSGKAALYLALKALQQCAPGTQVVVPAYTCFSVPSAVVKAGLKVVPCDVDPDTFDFDYGQLASAITSKTLCVIATHLFGIPADMKRIKALAAERGAYVIEDAAQAFGLEQGGKPVGTSGDLGIFSFGRGKQVTCGAGGLVVTNRAELARQLKVLFARLPDPGMVKTALDWGRVAAMQVLLRPWLYWIPASVPFFKLGHTVFDPDFPVEKMSPMKACLLEGWRDRLDRGNGIRRRHVEAIVGAAKSQPVKANGLPLLRIPLLCRSSAHRQALLAAGKSMGVGGMYPTGIHCIAGLGAEYRPEDFPGAAAIAERLVTLPTHHLLSDHDDRALACLVREEIQPAESSQLEVEANGTVT